MMKNFLLIIGIAMLLAGVIALLFSALQRFGYYHLLDGDAELYLRLRGRMILSFVIGIVLVAMGAVCLFIRTRL